MVTFATTQVKKGDISSSITATGNIEPVTEVEVGTQVSGIIDKIYVDYNSVVKEGQVIAEMDKVTLQNELESAKGSYDGAKAEFEYQERNYKRNLQLHEKALSATKSTKRTSTTTNVPKAAMRVAVLPTIKHNVTCRMPSLLHPSMA